MTGAGIPDAEAVLRAGPVIPVAVLEDARHAVPLARALRDGGVRVIEVTLRTDAALACIAAIAAGVPDLRVGAGSVRRAADVQAAADAGARFLVSPGYTRAIGAAARASGLPLVPGVATGSEILQAVEDGFAALKFFPAEPLGGTRTLRAWRGPFPDVVFCPTGGISPSNAPDYLALDNVACVGGSWLAPPEAIRAGRWDEITALARAAAALRR